MTPQAARGLAILLFFLLCSGCGGYQLRGKVIEGQVSAVLIVNENDPRLGSAGVAKAMLYLTIDPQSMGQKVLPSTQVQPDGSFAIPVDQFGTGLLEYKFGLVVRQAGYDSAAEEFKPPGGGKRVLVILGRGPDRYRPPEDPLREAEPYLRSP